ncbi:MAG: outer membrane beta-barrel protein [Candidatus Acidiferrales bacterium]
MQSVPRWFSSRQAWAGARAQPRGNEYSDNEFGIGEAQFVQNIYGGNAGGPIWKNKTFFFVNPRGELSC